MRLVSIWKAGKPEGHYVSHHTHRYHELVYYVYGKGETVVDGRRHLFTDGCFALIPPGVSHDERHLADGQVICLEFDGGTALPTGLLRDGSGVIGKILNDLLREAKTQPYGYRDMLCVKLNELCLQLTRQETAAGEEKNFEYMINYIRENYHEKILLADCAEQLSLSYDHFQHKFKALTGLSPQQFLIRERLEAARRLLRGGELSCTEVAYRCGFSTSAQFSALFKRAYGVTPLRYRKEKTAPSTVRL